MWRKGFDWLLPRKKGFDCLMRRKGGKASKDLIRHIRRIRNNDGHCVSPLGNPAKGKDLEEGWQDDGQTN